MHRSNVSRRSFRPALHGLATLICFAAGLACSASVEDGASGSERQSATGPTPTEMPSPSTAGTGGSGSVNVPNPPEVSRGGTEGTGVTPVIPNPATGGSTSQASTPASFGEACVALGSDDACAACVCGECKAELDVCATIDGCAEILACVRESGCSGSNCYCGDVRLTECVAGRGNGPCKDAVLAAPGSREPTLANPSGGPASDAALDVADCANDGDRCTDVCDLGN